MTPGIQDAKAYLLTHAKDLARALVAMANDTKTPASVRLKAIEMALDRIGLPALRATITQKVSQTVDLDALQETRLGLVQRQRELRARIGRVDPKLLREAKDREIENARSTSRVLPYPEG
jgi:hypothetical protein